VRLGTEGVRGLLWVRTLRLEMATDASATDLVHQDSAELTADARPYGRSWVNLIVDGIEALPGPTWVAFLVLIAVFAALTIPQAWVAGLVAFPDIDLQQIFWGVIIPFSLVLFHYLDGVAREALRAFRPALDASDAEIDRLRYELTVVPARPALALLIVTALITPLYYIADPVASDVVGLSPIGMALRYVAEVLFGSLLFVLVYHSLRQIRSVVRLHRRAERIDLFHPMPLYAFARLTARTGLIILFIFVVPTFAAPAVFEAGAAWIWASYLIPGILIAVAVFVLPLREMHTRLVAEKLRLQFAAEERLKAVLAELAHDVDAVDLTRADGLNKTLGSLLQQRDVLAKLPTWPWSVGTLRGFVTLILLPIALFLAQRILAAIVGLG
jgi:hypothetical protein